MVPAVRSVGPAPMGWLNNNNKCNRHELDATPMRSVFSLRFCPDNYTRPSQLFYRHQHRMFQVSAHHPEHSAYSHSFCCCFKPIFRADNEAVQMTAMEVNNSMPVTNAQDFCTGSGNVKEITTNLNVLWFEHYGTSVHNPEFRSPLHFYKTLTL